MTRRAVATVLLVTLVTLSLITVFRSRISSVEAEQFRICRLNNDITKVVDDLDSLLLGDRAGALADDLRQMESTMAAVEASEESPMVRSALQTYGRFKLAALKEQTAIREGNFIEARRLDHGETDPAYKQLELKVSQLEGEMEAQVRSWRIIVRIVINGTLLGSAAIIIALIYRFRNQVEAIATTEAREESIRSSERRMKSLIQNNSDVIVLATADGTIAMISDACEQAWGRSVESLTGKSIFEVFGTADAAQVRDLFDTSPGAADSASTEARVERPDGEIRDFQVRLTNLNDDPDVSGMLLTFHDLTERKKLEQDMAHHAFHDRLTGLPNRALFLDRLSHRLRAREAENGGFGVLFIDLDNFKVINDSLGHEAGDNLLIEVASRLQSVVRASDTVARLGGDEFTIILDEARNSEDAVEVAERILRTLVRPLALGNREVFVTCSIGVVMASDSGADAAGLLRDADTAMYHAKGDGKAGVTVFRPSMNVEAVDRMELESDLRAAIEGEQFILAYQPIVDMTTGRLIEVEALIRWQHPVRGLVSPLSFIPLAEETGLICPIGRWAFQTACQQLEQWNRDGGGHPPLQMSVNVSGRQLQEKGFVAEVEAILKETDLDPRLIELEVTETAMLKDMTRMKEVLHQLRELGLRIAIDDFGTGYSSMAYLSQLPVDKLKIDRSFVIPLGGDARADGVVQAMITMARTLGLGITGEGVETKEQYETLQSMGCDLGQGYLFNRPLSPESVTNLLATEATSSVETGRLLAA